MYGEPYIGIPHVGMPSIRDSYIGIVEEESPYKGDSCTEISYRNPRYRDPLYRHFLYVNVSL